LVQISLDLLIVNVPHSLNVLLSPEHIEIHFLFVSEFAVGFNCLEVKLTRMLHKALFNIALDLLRLGHDHVILDLLSLCLKHKHPDDILPTIR
jgi:hypothetical protein